MMKSNSRKDEEEKGSENLIEEIKKIYIIK